MELIINNHNWIQFALTIFGNLLLLVFIWRLRAKSQQTASWPNGMIRSVAFSLMFLFCLLAGYQARWQLFGFFSSDFLRVQRGFDPRDNILGTRFHRGSILDWKHRPLALDEKDGSKLKRRYPLGFAGAHVIGYTHPVYGSAGLEKSLENVLMGRAVQTPADLFRLISNVFFHGTLRGNPMVLTLDRDLQQTAWEALAGHRGAIVALDPRNGSIRAMVSRPGYNPEALTPVNWDKLCHRTDSPFLNRACQGLYPPGSTFKPVVASTALSHGINPVFICSASGYNCGPADPPVKDYDHYHKRGFKGHGTINMSEAMTESCNVYFAQLAVELTAHKILNTAKLSGCHEKIQFSGPGLPVEAGRLPEHETWYKARTARLGIGQDDLLLTPLHLALLAGAIGNGGFMYRPRLIEGEEPFIWKTFMDKRTSNRVARMMIKVVETGTGQNAQVPGVVVGGKTGTAENSGDSSHALFICFAPWPKPAIALAVVVESSGTGGHVAAPIAKTVIQNAETLGLLEDMEVPVVRF